MSVFHKNAFEREIQPCFFYSDSDTAAVYRNEGDIGFALKELLPRYDLKREDIFLTSKLGEIFNCQLLAFKN